MPDRERKRFYAETGSAITLRQSTGNTSKTVAGEIYNTKY